MNLQTFLLLILGGVLASTLLIVLVFIIINSCISRKSQRARYAPTPAANDTMPRYEMSSTFKHNGQEEIRPPLPPRNQFDTESLTNSYEDMPENPAVAQETLTLHNANNNLSTETRISFQDNISASESYDDVNDLQNVKLETSALQYPVISCPPETHINFQDNISASESYDDVDKLGENVQSSYEDVASLPDYLEVDPNVIPNESDNESENYDNVIQLHSDNDDYDDVG